MNQFRRTYQNFGVFLLLLVAVLVLLLHGVFLPDHTLFSNDGPLGRLASACHEFPDRFTGCWSDLNSIGAGGGVTPVGISSGLQYLLQPVWFSKLYALLSLIILGLGAWCYFSQLRLAPVACVLGGLAAALNSCFFSVACWGVAAQAINAGMFFFAMAALANPAAPRPWWRVVLAGLAVGMCVIEGSDIGAIYSLFIVFFILYQAWLEAGTIGRRLTVGLSRLAVVVVFAGFIAAQAVSSLVGNNITGIVGTDQDAQTKASRWDWATQWSLPVAETAGLAVPGLFGYRMDQKDGGVYWGNIGQDPQVTRYLANGQQGSPPRGFLRYSGGGFYAGLLVLVVAFWAGCQALRGKTSCFTATQCRWLWFWLVAGGISLLLAYGRFAPFYQWVYALPYFSTIRNPVKFINLVSVALIILFAHGLDGLCRLYFQSGPPALSPLKTGGKNPAAFDRLWVRGLWMGVGVCALAWIEYATSGPALAQYLRSQQIKIETVDGIASFSIHQAAWALFFLVLAAGLITAIIRGRFTGARARWGAILLGLLLFADLGRANLPWVFYWNYVEKYASNPVLDLLRERPYENRVAYLAGPPDPSFKGLYKIFRLEWLQQLFPYYNIQALDVIEMPRVPADLSAYSKAINATPDTQPIAAGRRLWQLTSCRYVLARTDAFDAANQAADPAHPIFRLRQRFDLVPKPGHENTDSPDDVTAILSDTGPSALFENTEALPRVALYSHWEVNTNNQAVLADLGDPAFDFTKTILVSGDVPAPASPGTASPNQTAGTVTFASYAPKHIVLQTSAPAATVLLYNDHYDPDWRLLVDGRPEKILRCNFIMRGVYLPPGSHTLDFSYQPPYRLIYVSLAGIGLALVVLTVVLVPSRRPLSPAHAPVPVPPAVAAPLTAPIPSTASVAPVAPPRPPTPPAPAPTAPAKKPATPPRPRRRK